MVLLADLSIFELAFSNSKSKENRIISKILFNEDVQICFNQSIIDEFEKILEETEYFQAFVKELYDNDRIVIEKSKPNLSLQISHFFNSIINLSKQSIIFHYLSLNMKILNMLFLMNHVLYFHFLFHI